MNCWPTAGPPMGSADVCNLLFCRLFARFKDDLAVTKKKKTREEQKTSQQARPRPDYRGFRRRSFRDRHMGGAPGTFPTRLLGLEHIVKKFTSARTTDDKSHIIMRCSNPLLSWLRTCASSKRRCALLAKTLPPHPVSSTSAGVQAACACWLTSLSASWVRISSVSFSSESLCSSSFTAWLWPSSAAQVFRVP